MLHGLLKAHVFEHAEDCVETMLVQSTQPIQLLTVCDLNELLQSLVVLCMERASQLGLTLPELLKLPFLLGGELSLNASHLSDLVLLI